MFPPCLPVYFFAFPMNERSLQTALAHLNIGGLRYFDSIGSTNDEALAWAADGARDFSIVAADEQTRGRGRLNRKWFTPKGSAIAMSLILRPAADLRPHLARTVGWAALAIVKACAELGLAARIKWPNDILLDAKKIAGVLVEAVWSGDDIDALVIGVGINVRKESVPPAAALQFPAASLEDALGKEPPAREEFLARVLDAFIHWRARLRTDELIQAWNEALAFRGEQIQIHAGDETPSAGEALGVETDGSLRVRHADGKIVLVRVGDVSLRPRA